MNTFWNKFSDMVSMALYFEVIGVTYSICFFAGFELNYADYANIDDLILGSFKEPIVFVAGISTIFLMNWLHSLGSTSRSISILILLSPIFIAAFIAFLACNYVKDPNTNIPFSNTGKWFEVALTENLKFDNSDQKIDSAKLIGTSGDYVFFYDVYTESGDSCVRSTIILPKSSILQMTRTADPDKRKCSK